MKNQKKSCKQKYEAPRVEVTEIAIEQGFAISGSVSEDLGWNDEQEW